MCNIEYCFLILLLVKSFLLLLRNIIDGYNCESDSKNEFDVCSIGFDK